MASELKNMHDYERHIGEGRALIYEGHPGFCPIQVEHEPHVHIYQRVDDHGVVWDGKIWCDGHPFPFASPTSSKLRPALDAQKAYGDGQDGGDREGS